jgi:acetylornithine/succinyldiaminopimelate/putrescine aminotransferase
MLQELEKKYPEIVTHVTGKGLLLALHINHKYKVDDYKGLEYICRENGLNVIHGGENALRFTPYFLITNKEIELIKNILEISIEKLK